METCIYKGIVTHRRFKPKRHFFSYKTFSILFDLDELEDFLTKIDDQIILLGEPSILSEKSLKESKIYHLNTGGSKFRCKVIFHVCKLYDISIKNAETIALTLENLHQASLIHDDIQDEDEIRRSFKTIWTKESIKKALLVGDMMIFESIKTFLNLENTSLEQLKLVFENLQLVFCL